MAFYDLAKEERAALTVAIKKHITDMLSSSDVDHLKTYFSDADTYIRKAAYIAVGRLYFEQEHLQHPVILLLNKLLNSKDFKIRQTVINAAGEIGKRDFSSVAHLFDKGLLDVHHSPRNAVIGSIKKMGEVNPIPVLAWSEKYLYHEDKEIRREICHGLELRGRKHPQDILPLLKVLQHDPAARVRKTLVHVIGQIAYKKDCLATVVAHLTTWENQKLVAAALEEIIDVHHRYRDFSALTQEAARQYIKEHFNDE